MIGLFDIQNLSAGSNYDAVFVFPFNHIELESNEISIQVQSAFESVIDLNQTHSQVWDEYETGRKWRQRGYALKDTNATNINTSNSARSLPRRAKLRWQYPYYTKACSS